MIYTFKKLRLIDKVKSKYFKFFFTLYFVLYSYIWRNIEFFLSNNLKIDIHGEPKLLLKNYLSACRQFGNVFNKRTRFPFKRAACLWCLTSLFVGFFHHYLKIFAEHILRIDSRSQTNIKVVIQKYRGLFT